MDKKLKIIAICGSPRRGNTYNILEILKQSDSEIDLKILMLSELNLMDCFGCYSCINTGEENCPLKDDRDMIIEEMKAADGTIFASPTYARTVSALMKKFVERTSYISHRPIFFGKHAMALTTCAGFGGDLTCKYLNENFTQSGFNFVTSLELMVSTKSETETDYNHKKAINEYSKLITVIKAQEEFKPSLGQLVYFNIFKSISELNKVKGWADYEFYKDKKDFYFDINIPFMKNKIAKWIAGREIKKMKANK
ncbi:flavodoxin family protein [Hyunsoonleella flava]|uniref:Flavodoxin family protein n=1 Tax=Hyunsoonleella flava TaxID=2527939 RepID=A0A4Q9FHH1_9FLAO|nr:NAD(P)H-dependent oxidoreductase [Hyunsoonleella flava]TBN04323.1 flavodoxin family protein [Hyunsoonleella flava]